MNSRVPKTLGSRLALWLALQSFFGLLAVCIAIYAATFYAFRSHQLEELAQKKGLLEHFASEALSTGDEKMLGHKLRDFKVGHSEFGLRVLRAEGTVFFEDVVPSATSQRRLIEFELASPVAGHRPFQVTLSQDIRKDQSLLERIAAALVFAALGGTLLVSCGGYLLVWLDFGPCESCRRRFKAWLRTRCIVAWTAQTSRVSWRLLSRSSMTFLPVLTPLTSTSKDLMLTSPTN